MNMTLRWFGPSDTVKLWQIRQIPGVVGVVSTLYEKRPGEVWEKNEVLSLQDTIQKSDLKLSGIESVNIHDSIKVGDSDRDAYIDKYIKTLQVLGECGIDLVCYNFMPVFDWTRSELKKKRSDGSYVLSYSQQDIDKINPENIFNSMNQKSQGHMLPGWEPERLSKIKDLFAKYEHVDEHKLFENLVYFLKAIGDVCIKYDIKMAIHPDDPAWPVFGLPRIMTNKQNLVKLTKSVNKRYNGVTLCTGSLGSNPNNDIVDTIRCLKDRIHFAHVRNIVHFQDGNFDEAAHLSSDGSMDMVSILKAFFDIGFDGVMRPDHGRMIWGERAIPGYGLYDRALGASYIVGIWETLSKLVKRA
ncbi:MAG: mannonate dehydratase [Clostridiales bacterium]|jgi:mannonate dehydratase|nr:mannonate dehydratase [Clostridiales bacterium]